MLLSQYTSYHSPPRPRVGCQREGPTLGFVDRPVLPLVVLAAVVHRAAAAAPQRGLGAALTTLPSALHCCSRDLGDSTYSLTPICLPTRLEGSVADYTTCCATKHCLALQTTAPRATPIRTVTWEGSHQPPLNLPRLTPLLHSSVRRACCLRVCRGDVVAGRSSQRLSDTKIPAQCQ